MLEAFGLAGPGVVPVGAIIPISANLVGAYPLPASGTVDANGWMRVDGSVIPYGCSMSGTLYDLTGSRFLLGSSGSGVGANFTAGSIGGANTATLTASNIPSLNSAFTVPSATVTGISGSGTTLAMNSNASHSHTTQTYLIPRASANYGSTGAFGIGSSSGDNATNTDHTHNFSFSGGSGTYPGFSGTASYSNTASAFSTLPSYVAAVYLQRVK